jgi:4-hydroxyphenylpyruvate dioxygenase
MVANELMYVEAKERVSLKGFDYVELYVGNVLQAAHFYRTAFGFTAVAYCGLETGVRDRVSVVMEQNGIRLVLTSALDNSSPIADHVRLHGDGVKDIALKVDDATEAFEFMVRRGARPVMEPTLFVNEESAVTKATVGTFGDTVHSFIQTDGGGSLLPGYRQIEKPLPGVPTGLLTIDHIAVCVEEGQLDRWVEFYARALGFHQSHSEDVGTEYSAMNSKVMQDESGAVKFPIIEPARAKRKSQIEEYLAFHHGAGVQHVALSSGNILSSVHQLRRNGNEFLRPPQVYYEMLEDRIGKIAEDVSALRELDILVDCDAWGYLMQIFTKPLQSQPTLFMEVIQRKEARGFGGGNIKALFEAVEVEQARRGNL